MSDALRLQAAMQAERVETTARIDALAADLADVIDAAAGVATDDEHDPEGATIAFERSRVTALIDQARGHLADVDAALVRLAAGSYGRCEACGRVISAARLEALPATATCIDCAAARPPRHREGGRLR